MTERGAFGHYTLWNRFLCLLRGHMPAGVASPTTTLDTYFCVRCNCEAMFMDRLTGRWYLSFDAWWNDLDEARISEMRRVPIEIALGMVSRASAGSPERRND